MSDKVIAFSLWGDDPKYNVGAVRNAELAQLIYPDWECWFYVRPQVVDGTNIWPPVLTELMCHKNVRVIRVTKPGDWTGMFDRFEAASDPRVDVMISRDCDSRLTDREKAAVDEWLESNKGFHTIHDHAHHTVPVLGGLWGIKSGVLPEFGVLLEQWPKENRWQTDQEFLTQAIWPRVKHNTMNHAEFHTNVWAGRPIPLPRSGREFIGATYDENDVIDSEQQRLLYGG